MGVDNTMAVTKDTKEFFKDIVKSCCQICELEISEKERNYACYIIKQNLFPFCIEVCNIPIVEIEKRASQHIAYTKNKQGQKRRHEKRKDYALTEEQWADTLEHFKNVCAYCGKDCKMTYDHYIPFSKNGSFEYKNVIPSCKSCNSSKGNKDFKEWYKRYKYYKKERESKILKFVEE